MSTITLSNFNLPKTYVKALEALTVSEEEKQLAEAKTKEVEEKLRELEDTLNAYRNVLNPDSFLDLTQIAEAIGIPNLGRIELFEYLRSKSFIQQEPSVFPYQIHIDSEYAVIETASVNIGGEVRINRKTKFTFKGLEWLVKKLKSDRYPVHTDAQTIWDLYNS